MRIRRWNRQGRLADMQKRLAEPADWNLYRSFLAVLREGSLSAAARRLGSTQPTVGRHLDALEAALGTPLFRRTPQGLVASAAAQALRPHAEAMEASAAALLRAVAAEDGEGGTVRISASDIVGCEVLPRILAGFRARYPRVALELVSSNRLSNLLTREADIAVRMIRPEQGALVARHLGTVRIGLYAHRDYLARRGLPRSVEELRGHSAIGFDADAQFLRGLQAQGLVLERELFDFRSDNQLAQLAAIRAGLGIGGLQRGIARREPDLVPVLPAEVSFRLEMWLAMHQDLRGNPPVRRLFDHLAAELGAYCEQG